MDENQEQDENNAIRSATPLCDLDEQKFPNPNHMNQLLRNTNNVENSLMLETINSSVAGNNIKNGAGVTIITDGMPTRQEETSNYEQQQQQMHVRQQIIIISEKHDRSPEQQDPSAENSSHQMQVPKIITARQPNIVLPMAKPVNNMMVKKTRISGQRKTNSTLRAKGNQSEKQIVVPTRVYQMSIIEEVNSFQPAMVLRSSISPPAGGQRQGLLSGQGSRRNHGRMNTTYFNDQLQLQQTPNYQDNRFSHFGLRKSIRDQVIADFKEVIPHSQKSPNNSGGLFSPKQQAVLSSLNDQKYLNRTGMSQRFSNQRLLSGNLKEAHSSFNPLQTPNHGNSGGFLPRLNLKSQGSKRRNMNFQSNPKFSEELMTRTNTNIIIHEMGVDPHSVGFFKKTSRPFTNQNTTRSGQITFEPNSSQPVRQSVNSQNQFGQPKREYTKGPLVDFKEYEILTDDKFIANNTYSIVSTTHPHHSRKSSVKPAKAVFKVVSPRSSRDQKSSRRKSQDADNTEESIRQAEHKQELKKVLSLQGFEVDVPFFSDGIIKTEGLKHNDQQNGFRDFIVISDYYSKFEKLKRRYEGKKISEKKFYQTIKPESLLILKQIYPRVFSIKNQLKGTMEDPDIEFNPVEMNQYEIFIVKSVSYLIHHDLDKAYYFLAQGEAAWPNAAIEFRFNIGLLHYLKEEYAKSVAIYSDLLLQLQDAFDDDEQTINLILSLSINLILSLLKDGQRYEDILKIQKFPTFSKIKMLKQPLNFKIQQLITYSTYQYKMKMKKQKAILTGLDTPNILTNDQEFKAQPLRHSRTMRNSRTASPLVSLSSASSSNDDDDKYDSISESSSDQDQEPQGESTAVNFSQPLISTATSNIKKASTRVASLSDDEGKKKSIKKKKALPPVEIKYDHFKKRGNNNFPLKNIKQLEVIKVKKQQEREIKAAANKYKNNQQQFLSQSDADIVKPLHDSRPISPKAEKPQYKVKQGQKAKFLNINNIQDTRSPDYIMSMTDIIGRLRNKEDIQKNKTLLYQLQKLEEVVTQGQEKGPSEDTTQEDITMRQDQQSTIPFPYQLNENQKKELAYSGIPSSIPDDNGLTQSPTRDTQIDICLKGLEELRLEVAMKHGGELERQDPIANQYKIICNSIYALLKEENLIEMLENAKLMKQQDGTSRKNFIQKISIAKEILISALLKKRKAHINMNDQENDQLVEIELLQEKVSQLKDILMNEANIREEKKNMTYMDKLEKDIRKMLIIARKKEIERDRVKKQEEEDHIISLNPDLIDSTPDSVLIETKSLPSLLKRTKFQEMIAERFKVDKKKFFESMTSQNKESNSRGKSETLTEQVLKKFKPVDPDQFNLIQERTQLFLSYIFETFGAYFIAQKTYCMTEFFDLAPTNIQQYYDNVSAILSSMPLRIPSLANSFTDNEWIDINQSEFIYNRSDIIHKVVSECFRQPKNLDYLSHNALESDENKPHDWIIEVTQKFNMLSVINFIMREGIKVYCQKEMQENSEYDQDPDRILHKQQDSVMSHTPIDSFVDQDSLNAIKDQFARLKYQGAFNTSLIDMLIGKECPIFRQFNKETREKIYRLSHLRSILIESETEEDAFLDIEKLSTSTVMVILKGNILYQHRIEEPQKSIMVEKVDKQKRRIQVMMPAGPPIVKWITKQVIGPGMAIPCQFLHWMKEKQTNYRFKFDKSMRTQGQTLSLDYLEFENKELSDLIYQPIYKSLVKKVQLIQNVDLFNGNSHFGKSKLEKLSPYVMFVMAALFKVQVFKMSEVITSQDEIPKSMFVILEGQARAVYEETLERKGEVCPYSRRSIRTDLPKDMNFSMRNNSSPNKSTSPSKNQLGNSPSAINAADYNFFNVAPMKKEESPEKVTPEKPNTITFQNLVFNQEWSEHQPAKKISFNHHIQFGFLTEGQYIASRVVLEEGALRNYIKTSREQINQWLEGSQQAHRQTLVDRIKAGYIKTQEKNSDDEKPKNTEEEEDSQDNASEMSELDDFDIEKTSQQVLPKNGRILKNQISFGSQKQEQNEERELVNLKNFLLKSQLSVVVVSSSLQAMVVQRQDKAYFHESVKKMLTEMIQEKNFIDLDRPIQKNKQIDFIRQTQKQWEKFKYRYEEHSLRETFHQKYEQFPR